ncbi:MAG: hypothetical protein KAG43_10680 [Candidatus Marithrix sp.]|nr:hypothetical protein [Candidatus Marithrix sp.]
MEHFSLIPSVLAIILAITTRNVIISLFIGIFSGYLLLNSFNPILAFGILLLANIIGIIIFIESSITSLE